MPTLAVAWLFCEHCEQTVGGVLGDVTGVTASAVDRDVDRVGRYPPRRQ